MRCYISNAYLLNGWDYQMSIHYDYIIDTLKRNFPSAQKDNLVFLDFGCGAGHIVEKGIEAGLDFYGADPYPRNRSDHYKKEMQSNNVLDQRIMQIKDDILPYPDNNFDAVCTNMVFEHIPDITIPMSEIKRVLKPGGVFLALFPTRDTWWEGHVNLYFVHWFPAKSKAMRLYLKVMKNLGLGKKSDDITAEEWSQQYSDYLHDYCFYRTMKDINERWKLTFGRKPDSLACDHMIYRFSNHGRLSFLAPLGKTFIGRVLFPIICHIRGARVLLVRS